MKPRIVLFRSAHSFLLTDAPSYPVRKYFICFLKLIGEYLPSYALYFPTSVDKNKLRPCTSYAHLVYDDIVKIFDFESPILEIS